MEQRCPACRARRMTDIPICPRCGCDFTLALCAEIQGHDLLGQAVIAWIEGNRPMALNLVDQSIAMKHGNLAEAIRRMLTT